MSLFRRLALAALGAGLIAAPALADKPRDADRAWEATREGRSMPLPLIERHVVPQMERKGAEYLGPEFNGRTYRFKFVMGLQVIWLDVDAATGRIVGRSRP